MSNEPVDLSKTPEFAIEEARKRTIPDSGGIGGQPIRVDENPNVVIFHNIDGMFLSFDPDSSKIEEAYRYRSEHYIGEGKQRRPDLEAVFRWNNVIDGTELPAKLGKRSLSVGDVVGVCTDGHIWEYYSVEPTGWGGPFTYVQVGDAAIRGANFDPFEGL